MAGMNLEGTVLITGTTANSEPLQTASLRPVSFFFHVAPTSTLTRLFSSTSAQNQEAEPLKGRPDEQPARGDIPSAGRVVLAGSAR